MTPSAYHLMNSEERLAYSKQRDEAIIRAFESNPSPTAAARAAGPGITRWVAMRVLTRAGVWNNSQKYKYRKDKHEIRLRKAPSDPYHRMSKSFPSEFDFQSKIEAEIRGIGADFIKEFQIEGHQCRADFFGKDFIIEAKVSIGNDDLCRGLGQCMVYRSVYPLHRIAIVYPDDIEPKACIKRVIVNAGFSVISFSEMKKWLP